MREEQIKERQKELSAKKELYMIGNSHIDPVWFWNWEEGMQEVKATYASALERMREFADFKFTSTSTAFFEWIEGILPEMFEEIKQRVAEGRWEITGGWFIEPDCILPCGEAFVRHGLYGQRYLQSRFGKMARIGSNVDSFGHNPVLPQILKKSGMDSYVFMRPRLDTPVFTWESSDGSRVNAICLPAEYTTWFHEPTVRNVELTIERTKEHDRMVCCYGVGNHGGGPTRKNIESIQAMNKREDLPELVFASPVDYFRDVERSGRALPVVTGELLHHASGCYSAHSEIKRLNRRAENRLCMAEKLSVMAKILAAGKYEKEELTRAWKVVLFNQFHDILAGASLEEAYRDAGEDYGHALHVAGRRLNSAFQSISWKIDIPAEEGMKPLVVMNPNAFETLAEVAVESVTLKAGTVLLDEEDNQIPYQLVQSGASSNGRCRIVFIAKLPSLGYRTYRFAVREKGKQFENISATQTGAENRWFSIQFDEKGYISSLVKKNDGTQYFAAPAAVPVVIRDESDTWSHGVRIFNNEVGRFEAVKVQRIEYGPVKAVIRVTSTYGSSRMFQDFSIYKELDYISVETTVDWHEKMSMLKLRFPVNMNYLRASYEIPYGVAQREPNGEEFPVQTWFDLEGAAPGLSTMIHGISILNDGKFAADAAGKNGELTVLRSPIYAQHEPYVPDPELEYVYLDQGVQTFTYGIYPHDGHWEEAQTVKRAKIMNEKPIALFETYHKGQLPQKASFLSVSEDNIFVEVLKEAEDGSGDLILRAYEASGRHTTAECRIPSLNREFTLSFTPFEIKTVRLSEGKEAVCTNMLEEC